MFQQTSIYLLKVIICSGLLMFYYWITLRNNRFHYYNRFYLLTATIASILLPLLHLEWFSFHSNSAGMIKVFDIIYSPVGEEFKSGQARGLTFQQSLLFIFLAVSVIMLVVFLLRVANIYRLKKKFPVTRATDFDFIDTNLPQAPFSFLKNIFWRADISLHEETGRQIMQHEIAHIKQKHSWDKLFLQTILCFYWMNPFFWLLKKELYLLHEFIADEKAIGKNDAAAFAGMLLSAQFGAFRFSPAQSIFHSPIKRRLSMLTSTRKTQFSYVRRLMALPMLATVICLFAFTARQEKNNTIISTAAPFKLVVDAGHGGKDFGVMRNGLYEKNITLKIARRIKELSSQYGIDVVLTRNDDAFMSPADKSNFSNAQHANAFISVHINAAEQSQNSSGFEVLVPKNKAQEFSNVLLGSAVLQTLQSQFKTAPALQQRNVGVWVIDNSLVPAILIECGYLTNNDDAKLLTDDGNIEAIAKNILEGVALFANNKNSISQQNIIHAGSDTSIPVQPGNTMPQAPLYVLDGKIISKEKADKLDPSSIDQINVLKGKDAMDKYGDKGKNGVVEITLKNSKSKPQVPPPPPPDPPAK